MRGGDKALLPTKAEAKADRYAPFFKNVDDLFGLGVLCLTALGLERGRSQPKKTGTGLNLVRFSADLLHWASCVASPAFRSGADRRAQSGLLRGRQQSGRSRYASRYAWGRAGSDVFVGQPRGLGEPTQACCELAHI